MNHGRRQAGFSFLLGFLVLLFAAVTLLLILGGKENVDQNAQRSSSAPAGLEKIEIALKNFAISKKRLPCPASATDATGGEAFSGTTDTCTSPDGVVPWGALGLTSAEALDSWSRRISYRVYSGATGFTQTDGLNATNCNTSTYLTTGVAVSATGACAAYHETRYVDFTAGKGISVNDKGSVVSGVAYVLISHGASGYGSFGNNTSGVRSDLPNASSKEYPNTRVPSDNTYWKQEASSSTVTPDDASHFDDVVYYKLATELLSDTRLAGRDWGTITVDKAFSSSTVTTGAAVTLTITISSTVPLAVKLSQALTDSFPTNLVVDTTPNASTTCASGVVTAVAGGTSVTLSAGAIVPARIDAVLGSCTVSVRVKPTLPIIIGSASIPYANTIAQYALEVTPNMAATAPPPSDAAAVRNFDASPTRVLTASPPPPVVTPSAGAGGSISPSTPQSVQLNNTVSFTVTPNTGYTTSMGGTCGGTLVGTTYTTNAVTGDCTVIATFNAVPNSSATLDRSSIATALGVSSITTNDTGAGTVSFPTFTLSAFADSPNLRNVSAASTGGIGAIVPGATTGATLRTTNNEGLRFVFSTDFRYLGITLLTFNTGGGGAKEQVLLSFYDASNVLVSQVTKQSCRTSPSTTNFMVDPGNFYRRVDIQARSVSTSTTTSSSFLLGAFSSCATGTAAACVAPGASAANDCP